MHCYLCFASAPPRVAPHAAGWEHHLLAAVCPDCQDRALAEHGVGWHARVTRGCYAGGRLDPDLFLWMLNRQPGPVREITLADLRVAYDEAMGTPDPRPVTAFGAVPFGALPVVYHQSVPEDMVFLYGGKKAGQSAVVYRDAYAHQEHRYRLAMRSRLTEIDAGFDKIQVALHRHLDALAEKVEARIAANTVHYRLDHDEQGHCYWYERRHGSVAWHGYRVS
jgi:hypothetical protein